MDWDALILSLKLSFWATVILLLGGIPLAAFLAWSRARWKFIIEALVALPLVLPPTVLGFYLLLALGPAGPIGPALAKFVGPIPFTFTGLLIASVIYSLPFAVQPFMASFVAVPVRYIEASRTLGSSRLRTFFRVALPLARPGVISGAVIAFAHTMGEFGVVLMIGGNIPGRTRTVSISIYDHVEALDYAAANEMALLLLGLSFAALMILYGLQRRLIASWPHP